MSDVPGPDGPAGTEDRVAGLDPVDGFAFESDGAPIGELDLASADALAERPDPVVEQVFDQRSWRFGHVIVDEAQDLTPMQWRMIARRSQGGAITIVGDLAQRSIGPPGEWADHLPPELQGFAQADLTINYRSPAEINELASVVLAELAPGLARSQSIRSVGLRPRSVHLSSLRNELRAWLIADRRRARAGRQAVIADASVLADLSAAGIDSGDDARSLGAWLTPWQAKGLEFDSVVVVEPAAIAERPRGLSLLYVALTRTTRQLTIVHERPLPEILATNIEPS